MKTGVRIHTSRIPRLVGSMREVDESTHALHSIHMAEQTEQAELPRLRA